MGFIGDFISADGSGAAAATLEGQAKRWDDLELLSPEEKAKKAYDLYKSGLISPDEYQSAIQADSSLGSYSEDPRLKEAQMRALGRLEEVGNAGGMDAQAKARLAAVQNQNAMAARGAREANKQNMAARGMGGSGMEAVASMIGDQGAATANNLSGAQTAAEAERRALDAITGAGNLGGAIRNRDFGQAEAKANAQDRINAFNAANKNRASEFNVANRNAAKAGTIGMYDTDFEQRRKKLQGSTDIMSGVPAYQQKKADSIGRGAGDLAEFGVAQIFSDERVKEDVEPAEPDVEEFLSKLHPSKWDYTDPKYGSTEGQENVGVMAQDMEKSKVGKNFVSEDNQGVKRIDYGKAQGTMLAILKTLADRVDELEGGHHAA